ncbi:MAG: slipin family protein [Phycisphaerales bacterium]|nr:MAG: slipin family protein [Phycisphaerales bacterium]
MSIFTRIRQHERGLLFHYGDFVRLLGPGTYRLWGRLWNRQRDEIQVVDTLSTRFVHPLLDVLLTHGDVCEALYVVDLRDDERALVWKDGRLGWILGAGRHAFWKEPYHLHVETFNVQDLRLEHPHLEAVLAHKDSSYHLKSMLVEPQQECLVFHNGRLVSTYRDGKHAFWSAAGDVEWQRVDTSEQLIDVSGQEIITSDKVSLRVNLLVTYQVADAVKAATVVDDYGQALYREAQLALRAVVGTRSLDVMLADKEAIGGEVRSALQQRADDFGVAVKSVGLRDIILPGEMRDILNRVITAEKEAQANIIKRREETAAARSQANTARLLTDNPALARIKELEMLQEILTGARTTFVLGSGDLVGHVRSLIRENDNGGN